MPQGPIIQLKGIRKSFQDGEKSREILHGVDLEVERGEFLSIMGPSGSGKTTLLRVLGSLLPPDSGQYLFDGEDLYSPGKDLSSVRNARIGFMYQDHRLLPQLTLLQNITLPSLAYAKEVPESILSRARHLMEVTGIGELGGRYPGEVSGGEESRASLCRALIMSPALLLSDEPTGNLDHENSVMIAGLLREMNRTEGTTIVMVTHSKEVAGFASRCVPLDEINIAGK